MKSVFLRSIEGGVISLLHLTYCLFDVLIAVTVLVAKTLRIYRLCERLKIRIRFKSKREISSIGGMKLSPFWTGISLTWAGIN